MSADNWTVCPKCLKLQSDKKEKEFKKARDSYGKVPADVYEVNMRRARVILEAVGETLREDYEVGVDTEGNFLVAYSCSCSECEYTFKYQHEQKAEDL